MATNSEVKLQIKVDDTNATTGLKNLNSSVAGLGVAFAGLAVSSAVLGSIGKASVDLALTFEQSFAKVSTLFGDVEVNTDNLKDKIFSLSTATGVSADALNEGLYSALSAGIPVTEDMGEAMKFLESSVMLATAGFTTTEKAVDVATTVLNSYGLEVSETDRVMNTLIETQNAGKTTVDELASSLGKVIPTASTLGVNFEELSASVAVMTSNGISTAETMTKLKSLMVELNDPASNINGLFKKISGETFPEFIKNGGSLEEGLAMIKGQLDEGGQTWGEYLGSVEAVDAATILMKDNGNALRSVYQRMTDDTTELTSAYDTMQTASQTLAKITEGFKNELAKIGIEILDKVAPALEWLADNMETVAPIAIKLTVALASLILVMSAVKLVTAFTASIQALGAVSLGTTTTVATLGKAVVSQLATPWGLALAGMLVIGYIFRDEIGEAFADVKDSFMEMTTGMSGAQREFNDDITKLNDNLADELLAIDAEYMNKVKAGDMTLKEAREGIAVDSAKARLETEKKYQDEYAQLQEQRVAEELVRNAKSAGTKKELMDSTESELLELRKSYDEKTILLGDAMAQYEQETDETLKAEKLERVQTLNDELEEIESKAGEDMLILKSGNRAKDEDGFINYSDSIKSKLGEMNENQRKSFEQSSAEGKRFHEGNYKIATDYWGRQTENFKLANNDMVKITTDSNGQLTALITDELGNQLEAHQKYNGEIVTTTTDANGAIIEATEDQKEQLSKLESENWRDLITIANGGGEDVKSSMDNMWAGILESSQSSDSDLRKEARSTGTKLALEWRNNGDITITEYNDMISQLSYKTSEAVDDANNIDGKVSVKGDKEGYKKFTDLILSETDKAIKDANGKPDVKVQTNYKLGNKLTDVVDYNPPAVNVPVGYSAGQVGANIASSLPRHADGAIVSGTEYAMIGESGPEMVLPLNMQGASFLSQLMPQVGGGGDSIKLEIGSINGVSNADMVGDIVVEKIDKLLGKRTRRR